MTELIDTVAAASAECGMQLFANWLPAERHGELRETLYDLAVSVVTATAMPTAAGTSFPSRARRSRQISEFKGNGVLDFRYNRQ